MLQMQNRIFETEGSGEENSYKEFIEDFGFLIDCKIDLEKPNANKEAKIIFTFISYTEYMQMEKNIKPENN